MKRLIASLVASSGTARDGPRAPGCGRGVPDPAGAQLRAVGMAPQVSVKVYVGSDVGSNASNAVVLSTYTAMVDQDAVKVISTSWGECERDLGAVQVQAEALLFAQAASQGQTVVAAAGDAGSEGCFGDATDAPRVLQVEDPASQPWVTGVGGTTLSSLGPAPTEQVWNNVEGAGGRVCQTGGRCPPGKWVLECRARSRARLRVR